MKDRIQLYEGMYIISSSLSEDARGKALSRITSSIEEHGGKIEKTHDWGRRKLAYSIDRKKEGHFYILYYTLPASQMKELWEEYKLNEDLLRFMTTQADEAKEKIEFKSLNPS